MMVIGIGLLWTACCVWAGMWDGQDCVDHSDLCGLCGAVSSAAL